LSISPIHDTPLGAQPISIALDETAQFSAPGKVSMPLLMGLHGVLNVRAARWFDCPTRFKETPQRNQRFGEWIRSNGGWNFAVNVQKDMTAKVVDPVSTWNL